MRVSGCIVTYNNADTIEKCVSSILESTKDLDFTLYISDNDSKDNTLDIIREKFPEVVIFENGENFGFGTGHNLGLKKIRSDIHFVINPDIYVDTDVIKELTEYLVKNRNVGMIQARTMNMDGTEQYLPKYCPTIRYCVISKIPGFKWLRRKYTRQDEAFDGPTKVMFCTGSFFGARTKFLKEMGGFSKRYFMYCEDADLSTRVLKAGKDIIFYPTAYVYHDWHRENTKSLKGIVRFAASFVKYFNRWGWKF